MVPIATMYEEPRQRASDPPTALPLPSCRDTRVDPHHPLVGQGEVVAHFGGHEVAHGVHQRAPLDGLPEERLVRQGLRPAQLGRVGEREVVDGHDDGRARRRRDEVGRMDDVDRAGPVLDSWPRGACPQRVRHPGGYPRGCRADAGRQDTGEVVATGAGDRVRRRPDVVAVREAVEERRGEVPDARAFAEQWVRIDGDAQTGAGTGCHGRRGYEALR